MLDIKTLRADPEQIAQALAVKGYVMDIQQFVQLEEQRKRLQSETEKLQNERNVKSKSIGQAKANGEDIQPLLALVGDLGERLDAAKAEFATVQEEQQGLLMSIPNLPHSSVPAGRDENDNVELHKWGTPKSFDFEPLDHVDMTASGGLDFETAAKISGARYVVMRGNLARYSGL